jgi:hypothetical protein
MRPWGIGSCVLIINNLRAHNFNHLGLASKMPCQNDVSWNLPAPAGSGKLQFGGPQIGESNVELMMHLFCFNNLKCTRWDWPELGNFLEKLNMTSMDEVPWIIWIQNNESDIMRWISVSRTSFEDPWMKLTAVNEMDWQFNVLKTNEMIDEHS